MLTFKEYLTEVFSKPYKWTVFRSGSGGYYAANAKTNDNKEIEIVLVDPKVYDRNSGSFTSLDVDFSVDDRFGITNEGDQFRIFATVMDFIGYVLKKEPGVNSISFGSNKSKSNSRTNLYKRMLKRYLPKWKISVTSKGNYDEITAFKPE